MTCKTSKSPGPALLYELPLPVVYESNSEMAWLGWDDACAACGSSSPTCTTGVPAASAASGGLRACRGGVPTS